MSTKKFVTDLIGNGYLEWSTGDRILISTPTGSGKSTFVISSLLKNASDNGKHVVYFCNRKVLNSQFSQQSKLMIADVFGKDVNITEKAANHLHIFTYQGSELQRNYPTIKDIDATTGEEILLSPQDIMYYVFDEAHYFTSDALINENTNFWYNVKFNYGISVFLTATPKPLVDLFVGWERLNAEGNRLLYEEFKKEDKLKAAFKRLAPIFCKHIQWEFNLVNIIPQMPSTNTLVEEAIRSNKNALNAWYSALEHPSALKNKIAFVYNLQPDYSYIQEKYFKDYEELLPEIKKKQDEKWLIFVDREDDGKLLENTYHENGVSAYFLSGSRIRQGGTYKEIYNHIVQNEEFPVQVLIATSALDCGINIKDRTLKNIVIANDNETIFLQMLGRKRVESGETVRLFIKYFNFLTIHN